MKLTPMALLPELHLARAGPADLDVLVGQDLGTAVVMNPHCFRHCPLQLFGAIIGTRPKARQWPNGDFGSTAERLPFPDRDDFRYPSRAARTDVPRAVHAEARHGAARGLRPREVPADALAGLTVAIVALPLSMAIAIASGASPDRGLYTAIVGGFLISALGGSRFQIGGPAGAFIVLVAATIERHGYDGLLATMIAGADPDGDRLLRLGTYIKYIPHPVTVGFTAGIAVIIFASQLRELFGLTLPGKEPAAFIPKLEALGQAADDQPGGRRGRGAHDRVILGLRRYRPTWPGFLIAVVVAASLTWALPAGRDHRDPLRRHAERAAGPAAAAHFRSRKSPPCCRTPSPSRSSAGSSRCSRPSSPTP
jgi:hypothetical protein